MLSSLNQAVLDWLALYGAPALGIWYVYSFILGACFGSFTTACVWRGARVVGGGEGSGWKIKKMSVKYKNG